MAHCERRHVAATVALAHRVRVTFRKARRLMDSPHSFSSPPHAPDLRGAVGLIVFYFALQMALGFLSMVVTGTVLAIANQPLAVGHTPALRSAIAMVVVTGAALPTLWLAHRLWPAQWTAAAPPGLGFTAPAWRYLVWAVVLGIALPLAGGKLTELLAHGQPVPQDVKQLGADADAAWRLALAVVVVTIGPLVEELLFRGVLLSALLRRLRPLAAVVLSALVFALAHLPDLHWLWYGLPDLALLGIAFAWLRLRSGSLWPAILAHACNNLLVMAAMFTAAMH